MIHPTGWSPEYELLNSSIVILICKEIVNYLLIKVLWRTPLPGLEPPAVLTPETTPVAYKRRGPGTGRALHQRFGDQ
jgi:hypothetical protein